MPQPLSQWSRRADRRLQERLVVEKNLFDYCILYSSALHHMEHSMPRPWRASVKCLSKTFAFLLVICKYVTFALVFSDINNEVTVVWVKATVSPTAFSLWHDCAHDCTTILPIVESLHWKFLFYSLMWVQVYLAVTKSTRPCIKRQNEKEKEKQITVQSVHQSQRYEWVSDVGRTMKDLDEKQPRSAQMIDTRGWPVCVVSYWCINYIQESCPNTSHTICRFSSQQERERAGLRLIMGLSPSLSEIQAKTFNVGGWGTQL